jgi:phosphoribosylformylglycinamidine cyclo-ligase
MTTRALTYAQAGVSIAAGDALVRRIAPIAKGTKRPGVLAGVGGFSALFELRSLGYRDPILVSSTDGVGTKLKIAFMTGIHDTVGIDLVAMSVNDILTQGAAPLFFLDYFVCGKLEVRIAEAVIGGKSPGCSAVSPPINAQPASRQPLAIPPITASAILTSSLPQTK